MPTTIQFKRNSAAQWATNNIVLLSGQLGYEKDTRKFKIGDGVTPWNSLGYAIADPNTHNHDAAYSPLSHASLTNNPHGVTKTQVGLSNADNTSDANKPISSATQTALNGKSNTDHNHDAAYSPLSHASLTDNPHSVTKTQVGLSNVDNTNDADKPISTLTQTALNGKSATTHDHNGTYLTEAEADLLYKPINEGGITISDTAPLTPNAGDLWFDSVNAVLSIYYNDGTSSQWVDVTTGTRSETREETFINYNYAGLLTTNTGVARIYSPRDLTLTAWAIWTSTAPTGTSIIAQILKNGVLIETATLPAGQNYATGVATASLLSTDYITINITQVGSIVSGTNLSIRLKGI